MKGDPLETFKKIAKKSLTKPKKNLHKKFLVMGGTRTQSKTILINLYAKWQ